VPVIQDTNYLSINNFRFDVLRLPETSFFVQSVSIPGFSFNSAGVNTPFTTIKFSGDHPQFDPLRVTFFVDAKMESYKTLFKWWQGLAFPNDHTQYAALVKRPGDRNGTYSDLTIGLLDKGDGLVANIQFVKAMPVSVGSIDFTYQNEDTNYATVTALFEYDSFDFV
jgi:hypothetical protein